MDKRRVNFKIKNRKVIRGKIILENGENISFNKWCDTEIEENELILNGRKILYEDIEDIEILEKRCIICGEIKESSCFSKKLAESNGYGGYCKSCTSKRRKELKRTQDIKENPMNIRILKQSW